MTTTTMEPIGAADYTNKKNGLELYVYTRLLSQKRAQAPRPADLDALHRKAEAAVRTGAASVVTVGTRHVEPDFGAVGWGPKWGATSYRARFRIDADTYRSALSMHM